MHVLVFEPRYKGHHLVYTQMLVEALLELGCKVTLGTGREVPATTEFGARMKIFEGRIGMETVHTQSPGLPRGMFDQLREQMRRTKPEHVLVPTADGLVQECGLMRTTLRGNCLVGIEAEALILRSGFAFAGRNWKQSIKYAAIREFVKRSGFSRLFTIDAVAREALQDRDAGLAGRMMMMPDPLDNVVAPRKADARLSLGIPPDGKYVGTTGILDDRKGIDRLIRAFAQANLPENHRLLVAGLAQPDSKALIEREIAPLLKSGRAIWVNRYLSNQDVATVIAAMDLVCTPYVEHLGPSAIVAKSAWIGRPVLATDYGWCGTIIPRFGIGWTCNTANELEFAEVLRLRLEESAVLESTPLLKRWFEYLAPSNFKATWMVRIRERMGLPPERIRTWNWVNDGEMP